MKIYIEILIPLVLLVIFLFWKIWFKFTERRLKKKYKPENDKGRKGTEPDTGRTDSRRKGEELGTGESESNTEELRTGEPSSIPDGLAQSKGRELLPKANTNDVGKNINSGRKFGFFRRRKS